MYLKRTQSESSAARAVGIPTAIEIISDRDRPVLSSAPPVRLGVGDIVEAGSVVVVEMVVISALGVVGIQLVGVTVTAAGIHTIIDTEMVRFPWNGGFALSIRVVVVT